MIFKYLEAGPLFVNCYIIADPESKNAVVVDPGGSVEQILNILAKDALKVSRIINTHCHFDHTGGNAALHKVTNAPICIHPLEKELLGGMSEIALQFGMESEKSPPAELFVEDGDVIEIGGEVALEVLHTPGHSPGHIALKVRGVDKVLSGDTLFQFGIGRTDFPGSSHEVLLDSIRTKLFTLGDNCEVYPGHGPPTLIGREKQHNPFLSDDSPL